MLLDSQVALARPFRILPGSAARFTSYHWGHLPPVGTSAVLDRFAVFCAKKVQSAFSHPGNSLEWLVTQRTALWI